MSDKKLKIDVKLLAKVVGLAKPYTKLMLLTILLSVILAPVAAIGPYLVKVMVDEYIFAFDISGLTRMAAIFMAIVIINSLLRYVFMYYTALLGQNIIRDLRVRVFKHLLSLKLQYFDQTPIGNSTTRTINDIETINSIFTQGLIAMVADILSIFAVLGIMFYTSWRLTLISLLTIPFLLIATYIFKEKVKLSFQKVRAELSKMNAFLQERITGMRIVQIFNAEKREMEKFKIINRAYTQANLDSILYYAVFFPVVELIHFTTLALLVWLGARGFLNEQVSFGALVAFPMYLNLLFRPIRMLADKFNTLQMGMVAADRVFEVLENESVIKDTGYITSSEGKGKIEFKNVRFSYTKDHYILKDINFEIKAGEKLAIVGSTGSGKTTLINILSRFYELNEGSILIDGIELQKYDRDTLRQKMAIVLQDVFLFTGSVLENMRLKDESISTEDIVHASKIIGAHPFIEKLPGGYDFEITERGQNLSMGQRQLISFVRALVINPEVLILDEATSSIDTETETVIQFAIEKLIEKRTSIIIAHRLSTIRNADNILVMDQGRIVEFGPHEKLVQIPNGHYRKLYEMQFADFV
jgi:ATP-binding cassette subfamily B protein